jgi:hypothetical protein
MDEPGVRRTAGIRKDRRELETEIRRCMPSSELRCLGWVASENEEYVTDLGIPAGQIKTAR